jgi:hypothetical protein
MLKRFSGWLRRVSQGWVVLAAVGLFALFMILVLPAVSSRSAGRGEGAGSPDTLFWYPPSELYAMAEAYGEEGRAEYVRERFTFDLVWPLVYGFFLTVTIGWLYERAFAEGSFWQYANLAPTLGALFDYLENVTAALVVARYPARTPVVDGLASLFTPLKWVFVGGSFALLLAGIVAGLWSWYSGKRVR